MLAATYVDHTAGEITLTASGTTHTKGSWVTLIDPLPADVKFIMLTVSVANSQSNVVTGVLLDIGIGAAGAESVAIPNIQIGYDNGHRKYMIPLNASSGARIAARIQSSVASKTAGIIVVFYGEGTDTDPPYSGSAVEAMGASTGTSLGTVVAQGSPGYGSWVVISASTPNAYDHLIVQVDGADTGLNTADNAVQLGVGGSGLEVPISQPIVFVTSSTEQIGYKNDANVWLPDVLPAGSRLVARSKSTGGTNNIGVAVHGVRP